MPRKSKRPTKNPEREERISIEIIADAHDSDELAMRLELLFAPRGYNNA